LNSSRVFVQVFKPISMYLTPGLHGETHCDFTFDVPGICYQLHAIP